MNIFLLGYMGSGKSTIGKKLATSLNYDFLDFDAYIASNEQMSISEIFKSKGEIYFRKKETFYLHQLIKEKRSKTVIALGGGTPCYGSNMKLLKESKDHTVYINVPYKTLAKRLWIDKNQRPLVANMKDYDSLEDYIRKHIFERAFYYNQAQEVVGVIDQSPKEAVLEIKNRLL